MKVFLTGGTGYVGGTLLSLLSLAGHETRVLSRDPEPARQRLATMSGAFPVRGDITEYSVDQLAELMKKQDAVVHLVGIIIEKGTPGFEMVHPEGTRRMVGRRRTGGGEAFRAHERSGHAENAVARYHKSKFAAEQFVRESDLDWTIFRPSIIFGENDEFLNTFAGIARMAPALPLIGGGRGKLQPIWVEDVCRCFAQSLNMPETIGQTYDMGGDTAYPIRDILSMLVKAMGKKRLLVPLPTPVARLQAKLFNLLPMKPPFTEDQITMLGEDNVCDPAPMKEAFGLTPRTLENYLQDHFGR